MSRSRKDGLDGQDGKLWLVLAGSGSSVGAGGSCCKGSFVDAEVVFKSAVSTGEMAGVVAEPAGVGWVAGVGLVVERVGVGLPATASVVLAGSYAEAWDSRRVAGAAETAGVVARVTPDPPSVAAVEGARFPPARRAYPPTRGVFTPERAVDPPALPVKPAGPFSRGVAGTAWGIGRCLICELLPTPASDPSRLLRPRGVVRLLDESGCE